MLRQYTSENSTQCPKYYMVLHAVPGGNINHSQLCVGFKNCVVLRCPVVLSLALVSSFVSVGTGHFSAKDSRSPQFVPLSSPVLCPTDSSCLDLPELRCVSPPLSRIAGLCSGSPLLCCGLETAYGH